MALDPSRDAVALNEHTARLVEEGYPLKEHPKFPQQPASKKWLLQNGNTSSEFEFGEHGCCVWGCRSKSSIRNCHSLRGPWPYKPDMGRAKICIYHYNSDLMQYPREKRTRAPAPDFRVDEYKPGYESGEDPNDDDYNPTFDVHDEPRPPTPPTATRRRLTGRKRTRRNDPGKGVGRPLKSGLLPPTKRRRITSENLCCIRSCRGKGTSHTVNQLRNPESARVKPTYRRRRDFQLCLKHWTELNTAPKRAKSKPATSKSSSRARPSRARARTRTAAKHPPAPSPHLFVSDPAAASASSSAPGQPMALRTRSHSRPRIPGDGPRASAANYPPPPLPHAPVSTNDRPRRRRRVVKRRKKKKKKIQQVAPLPQFGDEPYVTYEEFPLLHGLFVASLSLL